MTETALILNRDLILKAIDKKVEPVKVPEWGGTVYVRNLTGTERDIYEASMVKLGMDGKPREIRTKNVRATLCALSMCDEQGNRLFGDDAADVALLGEKNAAALDRVFTKAQRLSGLSNRDVDELTDGLKKGRSDGSTSA